MNNNEKFTQNNQIQRHFTKLDFYDSCNSVELVHLQLKKDLVHLLLKKDLRLGFGFGIEVFDMYRAKLSA